MTINCEAAPKTQANATTRIVAMNGSQLTLQRDGDRWVIVHVAKADFVRSALVQAR